MQPGCHCSLTLAPTGCLCFSFCFRTSSFWFATISLTTPVSVPLPLWICTLAPTLNSSTVCRRILFPSESFVVTTDPGSRVALRHSWPCSGCRSSSHPRPSASFRNRTPTSSPSPASTSSTLNISFGYMRKLVFAPLSSGPLRIEMGFPFSGSYVHSSSSILLHMIPSGVSPCWSGFSSNTHPLSPATFRKRTLCWPAFISHTLNFSSGFSLLPVFGPSMWGPSRRTMGFPLAGEYFHSSSTS
mmetsp:Transcript_74026/g.193132  ORF Transcript_74026/g.193132 Transcript_74026/m.193132 type:complete len:243 (-) Transcript_74026:1099-1827(-)